VYVLLATLLFGLDTMLRTGEQSVWS